MSVITFSQAVEGWLISCRARGLSINTIDDYTRTIGKFIRHRSDDPRMTDLTSEDIVEFLASCEGVSNKSKRNYYIGLSSLWTWAIGESIVTRHVVRDVPPPKPEQRLVEPFTIQEVRSLLSAINRSKLYRSPSGAARDHANPSADRNRAMILLLLDTGLRASELIGIRIRDLDLKKNTIIVMGKGSKERSLPISARTAQSIWRYLAPRENRRDVDHLFVSMAGAPITRRDLYNRLLEIGKRADVRNVHPHRFRHTFAITYLRNGGDVYTLQAILGHSTLEMVRHYARIAQMDVESTHRRASPVENWRL